MRFSKTFVFAFALLSAQLPRAFGNEGNLDRLRTKLASEAPPEIQKWTGVVQCQKYSHTSDHRCDLELVEDGSGDSFDIEENSGLLQRHCQNDRNLQVDLTAEKTPRFLFWGGALKVKSFEVIKELEAMPRTALLSERPRVRSRGGR